MNSQPDSTAPESPANEPSPTMPEAGNSEGDAPDRDWGYWARRLLVCNPFFLCSAALLLFGVNRLSTDRGFLDDETQNLLFNFFALQGYELLVVVTAIVLARRKVWYDSALLVVLENGLVLVPFMLISQAALIGGPLATSLTLAGGALAASRFAGVRRWYPQFNLPPQALWLGLVILAANVALPRVFRPLMTDDVADWRVPNLVCWYVLLPVLVAGANLLPRPTRYGGLNPERHWLPLFSYGLWVSATAVHLWCVQHICELPFELSQLAPAGFALAWTMRRRIGDCVLNVTSSWDNTMLWLTAAMPALAWGNPLMEVTLCGANIMAYAALAVAGRESSRALARHLALVSCALLVAGCPLAWGGAVLPVFTRAHAVVGGLSLYVVWRALRSGRPELGVAGACAVTIDTAAWLGSQALHPALQAGLVFALCHSLRWRDNAHPGAGFLRNTLAMLWLLDSVLYTRAGTSAGVGVAGAGAVLLLAGWLFLWWRGQRAAWILPVAAGLTLLMGPGHWLLRVGSVGVIALVGSVVLFAGGVVVAWTRHRWEHGSDST